MLPVILGHTPAGASTDQIVHYGQGIRSGHFRRYDFGVIANKIEYGSIFPPAYDLKNVKAPTALHYSLNDWLAEPKDVKKLEQGLGNVVESHIIADKKWNHFDFVWGIDARPMVYNRVLQVMKRFE